MTDHPILCPKCHQPLRHRGISNLRYCINPQCPDYKGIPPIKVNTDTMIQAQKDLANAMSDEVWNKALKEAHQDE